jgi:4-diphosphocytidyl-2C-methyl-D-erythritol kinase
LELPAFSIAPQLGALRERIENLLGRPVRMSGSGSSLFTLFDSAPAASEAAESIKRNSGETALAAEISPILMDDLNETFAIM